MKIYELHAHMDKNFVKKGDKVKAYETVIGTIGKGNGNNYPAHDHLSFSHDLTVPQLRGYIINWPESKVQKYYLNPHKLGINFQKMYSIPVNVGVSGYDYRQKLDAGNGYHPGVDINGLGGGDTDFGAKIKAAHNGTVIYEKRTWMRNHGWGNMIIIEWDAPESRTIASNSPTIAEAIKCKEKKENYRNKYHKYKDIAVKYETALNQIADILKNLKK